MSPSQVLGITIPIYIQIQSFTIDTRTMYIYTVKLTNRDNGASDLWTLTAYYWMIKLTCWATHDSRVLLMPAVMEPDPSVLAATQVYLLARARYLVHEYRSFARPEVRICWRLIIINENCPESLCKHQYTHSTHLWYLQWKMLNIFFQKCLENFILL